MLLSVPTLILWPFKVGAALSALRISTPCFCETVILIGALAEAGVFAVTLTGALPLLVVLADVIEGMADLEGEAALIAVVVSALRLQPAEVRSALTSKAAPVMLRVIFIFVLGVLLQLVCSRPCA